MVYESLTKEDLISKIKRLQMENDYLKKLNDIVQKKRDKQTI
jgi:hypothetical protein